ncbi:MAG: PhzF family phenazine biosynthesis protein [Imperialibacter sp.]|uniref:PhzF family phenazine biosynthesis protein n=1 Tax=Imperialibacter sp. TaxID=2038411 RepID=UPI0032EB9316
METDTVTVADLPESAKNFPSGKVSVKTMIVDAFTTQPFKGNPAAICFPSQPLTTATMQAIAAEMNLSETAFLTKAHGAKAHQYNIRFFTPTVEIKFCGHATLGSAKAVMEVFQQNELEFTTYHGLQVSAVKVGDEIQLTFPVYETVDFTPDEEILQAFGITETVDTRFAPATKMLLIEVQNKETLARLSPDYARAIASSKLIRQVIVTAKSDDNQYDFYSRCFCPWIGINEDPVTGASHSMLAPYWAKKFGKTRLVAYQNSKRGGYLKLNLRNKTTLEVVSSARIVLEGTMDIPHQSC